MDLHPDFNDLLAEFVRCGVRFVLLGGYAVGVHVKPRATKDLDLLVSGEGDNTIPVISLVDLIANKRASGRPQDLADVVLLERAAGRR
jgi:hypothetical protein